MTKIDIISGFLGAGKTTLIKKLLKDALAGSKVVLIENEFGEIGIDGGFLKDAGIEIREMNSGCICCSLVGDFGTSLKEVLDTYHPERILIEPSGVGKLSDVKKAVEGVGTDALITLNSSVAVVDAKKCKMYMKNFGEFFINQIEHAGTIVLSRTDSLKEEKLAQCIELIRQHNRTAAIITTPWDEIDGKTILDAIEHRNQMEEELLKEVTEHECCHGHGEGHECRHSHGEEHECRHGHGEEHECHHSHGEGHECHHSHGEEHGCHHGHGEEQEHHHEHDENCSCGCHSHEEGHHHADEIFQSIGIETASKYSMDEINGLLGELEKEAEYGYVLRAKGMLPSTQGEWIYFDYVPGEADVRSGKPDYTGKICVIGSELQEEKLKRLFEK